MENQDSAPEKCLNDSFSYNKFYKVPPKKLGSEKKSGLNSLENLSSTTNTHNSFRFFGQPTKKYNFFYTLPDSNGVILRIDLDIYSEDTVENTITKLLLKFNEKFKEELINIQFDPTRSKSFELILCTKTGKGKALMPSLDRTQLLSLTGITSFGLIEKEKEENKENVKKTKELFSLESKDTQFANESVENENFSHNFKSGSILSAKQHYSNSLINMRSENNQQQENNTKCLNLCKFNLCK